MSDSLTKIPYLDYGRDENGADCWGLVRIARKIIRGDDLEYLAALDPSNRCSKHAAYLSLLDAGVVESKPTDGAIVFVFFGSLCIHAGIVVTVDGRQCVMDTTRRTGVKITPLKNYLARHRAKIHDYQHLPIATKKPAD